MSEVISFTSPEVLKLEIEASPRTGYYDNKSEFLRDAVRTLLASRKDLRISIASVLYNENKISLGRACEIAELDIEEMKKILVGKGTKLRRGTETIKEMEEETKGL